jgi:hypothetical protein
MAVVPWRVLRRNVAKDERVVSSAGVARQDAKLRGLPFFRLADGVGNHFAELGEEKADPSTVLSCGLQVQV